MLIRSILNILENKLGVMLYMDFYLVKIDLFCIHSYHFFFSFLIFCIVEKCNLMQIFFASRKLMTSNNNNYKC